MKDKLSRKTRTKNAQIDHNLPSPCPLSLPLLRAPCPLCNKRQFMCCYRVLTYFVTFSTSRQHLCPNICDHNPRNHLCDHNPCNQLVDRHIHNHHRWRPRQHLPPFQDNHLVENADIVSTLSNLQNIIWHQIELRSILLPQRALLTWPTMLPLTIIKHNWFKFKWSIQSHQGNDIYRE